MWYCHRLLLRHLSRFCLRLLIYQLPSPFDFLIQSAPSMRPSDSRAFSSLPPSCIGTSASVGDTHACYSYPARPNDMHSILQSPIFHAFRLIPSPNSLTPLLLRSLLQIIVNIVWPVLRRCAEESYESYEELPSYTMAISICYCLAVEGALGWPYPCRLLSRRYSMLTPSLVNLMDQDQ